MSRMDSVIPALLITLVLIVGSRCAHLIAEDILARRAQGTVHLTLAGGERLTVPAQGRGVLCTSRWPGRDDVSVTLPGGRTVNGSRIERATVTHLDTPRLFGQPPRPLDCDAVIIRPSGAL